MTQYELALTPVQCFISFRTEMYEIELLSTTVATNCSGDFEANKHKNMFNTMTDVNFIRGLIHK